MSVAKLNSYMNVARRSTRIESMPPLPKRRKTTKTKTGTDPVESSQPTKGLIPKLDLDPKVLLTILECERLAGVDHTRMVICANARTAITRMRCYERKTKLWCFNLRFIRLFLTFDSFD
jgi:hypothetical protein